MKNTEKANAKNKRIQKALERNLFGPNGTFNLRVSERRCAHQEPTTPLGAPIPGIIKICILILLGYLCFVKESKQLKK